MEGFWVIWMIGFVGFFKLRKFVVVLIAICNMLSLALFLNLRHSIGSLTPGNWIVQSLSTIIMKIIVRINYSALNFRKNKLSPQSPTSKARSKTYNPRTTFSSIPQPLTASTKMSSPLNLTTLIIRIRLMLCNSHLVSSNQQQIRRISHSGNRVRR